MRPQFLLRGLALIALLVGLAYVAKITGVLGLLDSAWIDSAIRDRGFVGELIFVAAGALLTAIGVPRHLVSFLGGYAFGFLIGTGLALAAEVLGCITTFYYARLLGRGLLSSSRAMRKIDEFVRDNPFGMTLLVRLLPVGNNLAVNLGAGVSSVRGVPFFAGSALGYLPQTAVFALVGSGIHFDPALRIGIGVVLFVVSGLIGVRLYRQYRRERSLEDIEQQLG